MLIKNNVTMILAKKIGGIVFAGVLLLPFVVQAKLEIPSTVFKTEMKESVTIEADTLLFYDSSRDMYSRQGDGLSGTPGYVSADGEVEDMGVNGLISGKFIRVGEVTYTLKFYNVGALASGGFLGDASYADAELQIDYGPAESYKIQLKSAEQVLSENGEYYANMLKSDKKENVVAHLEEGIQSGQLDGEMFRKKVPAGTVDLPSKTLKLTFSGGPFGKFGMKPEHMKNGVLVMGEVENDATTIFLRPGGGRVENYTKANLFHLYPRENAYVAIPIEGDGFKKWMAIIEDDMGECSDPENPSKDSGIRFSDLWGQVEVGACNLIIDDVWDAGELDMVLHVEDHIRTGENYGDSTSGAVLSLTDMTTFKMRPNTEIVLSNPPEKESKIALISGKVWANLKSMAKDGSMKVEMSEAVCGIKGTTWVMEDDGQTSTLKVIDGEVEFMSKATGYYETVGPGEAISANASGMSEKTTFDVETEKANWENKEAMQEEYQDTVTFTYPEGTQEDGDSENSSFVWFLLVGALALGGVMVYRFKKKQ